jgi:DNA-binding NarL/FixJ family response regulator
MISLVSDLEHSTIVGQAAGGLEAVRQAKLLKPDMVLMDVIMPDMNGIEATRAMIQTDADILIIALSNHTGRHIVQAVMNAGARGYVRKDHAYEELVPALIAVAAGGEYIGKKVYD